MEFEELITILIAEHVEMKNGLSDLRIALSKDDFSSVTRILNELDRIFKQHITDEEAQVLRILIDAHGVKGADDAIKVFRQHRPIYTLMQKIGEFAALTPEELAARSGELNTLFEEHTGAEESRIFPKAISTYRENRHRC